MLGNEIAGRHFKNMFYNKINKIKLKTYDFLNFNLTLKKSNSIQQG